MKQAPVVIDSVPPRSESIPSVSKTRCSCKTMLYVVGNGSESKSLYLGSVSCSNSCSDSLQKSAVLRKCISATDGSDITFYTISIIGQILSGIQLQVISFYHGIFSHNYRGAPIPLSTPSLLSQVAPGLWTCLSVSLAFKVRIWK